MIFLPNVSFVHSIGCKASSHIASLCNCGTVGRMDNFSVTLSLFKSVRFRQDLFVCSQKVELIPFLPFLPILFC